MKKENCIQPLWKFASLMAILVTFVACSVNDDPVVPTNEPVIQTPSSWGDCFSVSNVVFLTDRAYGRDFTTRDFGPDSLLTGIERFEFVISSDESTFELRKTLEVPENTMAKVSMTDKYGEVQGEKLSDLSRLFNASKFSKKQSSSFNNFLTMHRGGEYECLFEIEALNIKEAQAIVLYGASGFDISGLETNASGNDINLEVECNTGYPYDYSSLLGNEYAKVTVYKVNGDNTETVVLSDEIELPFKKANKPLVAQIATLPIIIEKPNPGTYRLHFESNWKGLKERDVVIKLEESSETAIGS